MKILFLSVTIGAGHNAVANTIKKVFDDNGHDTKIVDLYKENKILYNVLSGFGFDAMYQFPQIANYYYYQGKKKNSSLYDNNVKYVKDYVLKEINDFQPDIIISSHIAGSIFLQKYHKKITKSFRCCFIITDYDAPPSLHNVPALQEIIFTPSDVFTKELVDKGFNENLVISSGIPINPKFYNKLDPNEIVKNRNLDDFDLNKTTILIMGGGKGLGKIKNIVTHLSTFEQLQLLVVCGKNTRLKSSLEKINKKNVFVFGFINYVDELMSLSQYIFGKTGGLSSTEAIAKDLNLISYKNIPCPEYENLRFLEKYGYATAVKNAHDVSEYILKASKPQKDRSFYIENSAHIIYETMIEAAKSLNQ